jgi:type III secretory pathway lipoprotein EscJ
MALQKSTVTKYGVTFKEAYYRIKNFTTVRDIDGNVDVSVALEIWVDKKARDNKKEPIDYVIYYVHASEKEAEMGTLSQLYQMIKMLYLTDAKDVLEK